MMWKASVILPCYNGPRWIADAVESVLAQTYEDFELVMIDDGSTDNSKEIVASYLCDERVRYIYQENRGFSAAVNRGIRESRGSLIGFIGQDDLWMPNKLELQVEYLRDHNSVDLVHSNYCTIDSEARLVRVRDIRMPEATSNKELVKELFLTNFIGFETVLVKKRCFDEVGLFDEQMVGSSDRDMWLRIAGKFNIGYIDIPLVKKREHKGQVSKVYAEAMIKDKFLMVKKAVVSYPFLKKVERKLLSSLYYSWGIVLLQKGNKKKAIQKFLQAIKCQPLKIKAVMAYLSPDIYTVIWDRYQKTSAEVHRGLRWIEG